jgi:dTDP-4-amino-4,6-dideoxygalactose transaminase
MAAPPRIPFNVPYIAGPELGHVAEASRTGHLSGDGDFTKRATAELVSISGAGDALLTTSCTHALEMAALLLDLEPGDEVLVPSFTFVSTASAFALRGAVPVFVDCRPDTLNIDETKLEASITDRTRAIVLVHYAGVACEMDAITAIAAAHDLVVIEDNAHGLGARYHGRLLGTFGALATQSFHETKNVQCGEGGALLVNDPKLLEPSEIIREKGTNRSLFFRGMVDKYTWVALGSSYLPSDLLAAFLLGQLESFDHIQEERHRVWSTYDEQLAKWADAADVVRPTLPDGVEHPAHLYYLLLPDLDTRQRFLRHLDERDVHAVFHYVPLHDAPAGLRLGRSIDGCPVTRSVSDRLARLPVYAGLSEASLERVVEAVTSFEV